MFFLDDEDLGPVRRRRGDRMHLGFALQLVSVRWLGAFLADPLDVPGAVLDFVAEQLQAENPSQVKRYAERTKTRFEHQWEIRQVHGLREFSEVEVELAEWVAARSWPFHCCSRPVTRQVLVVLDGSKALRRAVLDVFDHPVLARCQLHKLRNVRDRLPRRMRPTVQRRIRAAYHAGSALEAEAQLTALARELDDTHPSAANSVREGMAETLTVLRLGVPPTLARTLRSTNAIESMISICRERSKNVKRWRDGQMALRWCAAGTVEATAQFRRVNGHLHLPALRAALDRHVAEQTVGADRHDENVNAA